MSRLATIVVILLLLVLIAAGGLALLVRQSFPQTSGEVNLPGLHAPVEVRRDAMGIPHIYAEDEHDLFMAQGYVHAQDRFWQMDFWRHIGAGRLSEMFGESQVDTDAFIRTLGWPQLAEEEWETADNEVRSVLQAYADGVNAYLADHQGGRLSLEYAILRLTNGAYSPEPWQPVHSLTWAKAMAWDLGGNMQAELERAVLLPQLGEERLADLYPNYPKQNPVILPEFSLVAAPPADRRAAASADASDSLQLVLDRVEALNRLTGGGSSGIGSNNWVVAGARTSSGLPILSDDMHLGIRMPSIWYENGLHCLSISETCGLNVVGFSFVGLPAVVVGHNDRIAWGVTNANPDVQDLYLERINPDNPDQYEVEGAWQSMEAREEVILVAGGPPVTIRVRHTRHGPVLSDADDELRALAEGATVAQGGPIAVSLRWTALEPSTILRAALHVDRAQDFEAFRAALRDWDVPSQNFVYADVDGNIGYQMPGRVPVRNSGDGSFPVEGWSGRGEWSSYIPFEDLPTAYNPPSGFIATANNRAVDDSYPYLLTTMPDLGFRAARIVELIEAQQEPFTPEAMRPIHGDTFNAAGPILVPTLLGLDFHRPDQDAEEVDHATKLETIVAELTTWDNRNDPGSRGAAIFNAIWRHVILRTFGDDLPEGWLPDDEVAFVVVEDLLARPGDPWWDDMRTPALETRDEILRLATADAVDELDGLLGEDVTGWTWGALHGATFRNETLGESGIGPIEALFNRGPYPTGGGASIVDATGWSYEAGYEVAWVPSQRMVLDLSDWDRALAIHTTGQSGHAFHPHYVDMADPWAQIEYAPLPWTRAAVENQTAETLRLVP